MGRVNKSNRVSFIDILGYIFLAVAVFASVFPYLWTGISAIKPEKKMITIPPTFIFKPTFENIVFLLTQEDFLSCLKNSLVVSIGSSLLGVAIGSLAGYGLTRFQYRGREGLGIVIFALRFIPFIAVILPLYSIFGNLGLVGTNMGLIFAYQLLHVPLMTWLMRSFFLELPVTIEEAARVDGLSRMGTFFKIALPMAAPGVFSALLLGIIFSWNQYFIPLLLAGRNLKPLTLGLYRYVGSLEDPMQWNRLAAWAFMTVTPVIVLSVVVRKHIMRAFVRTSH